MTNNSFKDVGVVIPVREGSTRVKDKVTLPFSENLNLLEWKIEQLKQVLPHNNIYVSTDSDRLKHIATKMGVSIHDRDAYLCKGHEATFSEVITGVVKDIPLKHVAWVTVVVPLMSPNDYKEAFEKYIEEVAEKGTYDSLVAVNLLKEYFWDDEGTMNYRADKNHTISQDLPNIYRVTNGLYMMPKAGILEREYFLGSNPFKFQVSKMAGIDIDEWEDYEFAKGMLGVYEGK
jgi:CMP-N-acetylneuraminic acid synthetase